MAELSRNHQPAARLWVPVLFLAFTCLLALPSSAQDDYCGDPGDEMYVELMEAARVAIEAEDYDAALANFMLAYRTFQPGVLEFALARTYHHLERYDEAVDLYNRFLRHYADCPDPEGLRETAANYRNVALREQEATIEPPPRTVETKAAIHPAIWIISAGGALILGGAVFDLVKSGLDDDIAAAYDDNDMELAQDLLDERDTAETVDWVLYGTGTATLLAGVVLLFVLDVDESEDLAAGARPVRNGWVVTLGGRF